VGVVAAASYEARRYGIHSAMPMFMAKQRCPRLVIVSPRKGRYSEVSRSVMAILDRYSPIVEQVSIDEAYLDAAGCGRLYGAPRGHGAQPSNPTSAKRIVPDLFHRGRTR
jgi:DNA polymerase-4